MTVNTDTDSIRLQKLNTKNTNVIAKLLKQYWKSRGIHSSLSFAQQYLKKGHRTEISKDQFFEIKKGKKTVGVVSVIIWYHRIAEFRDLVTYPKFRGTGIGKKAIHALEDWSQKQGAKKIHCKILPFHWKWFKKMGYRKEGVLKNHFVDNENVIVIAKELKK